MGKRSALQEARPRVAVERMGYVLRVVVVSVVLVGCGGGAPRVDAAPDAPTVDAAMDAPTLDAPAIEASPDAPSVDAADAAQACGQYTPYDAPVSDADGCGGDHEACCGVLQTSWHCDSSFYPEPYDSGGFKRCLCKPCGRQGDPACAPVPGGIGPRRWGGCGRGGRIWTDGA